MKELIRAALEKWIYRLGLRWWTIQVHWHKGKAAKKYFRAKPDETILARTFSDWRYADASIHINLPAWRGMTGEEIERVVVHELVHVLVNEMRENEPHHEERVVTGLTKAFFWAAAAADADCRAALQNQTPWEGQGEKLTPDSSGIRLDFRPDSGENLP